MLVPAEAQGFPGELPQKSNRERFIPGSYSRTSSAPSRDAQTHHACQAFSKLAMGSAAVVKVGEGQTEACRSISDNENLKETPVTQTKTAGKLRGG